MSLVGNPTHSSSGPSQQKEKVRALLSLKRGTKFFIHIYLCLVDLLVYLPLKFIVYYLLLLVLKFVDPKLPYLIEDEIVSTTTWVIFTRRKHINQRICLKPWQLANEQVYNPKFVNRSLEYLLEGLEFNRRFAPGVYLGVAPVEPSKNPQKIVRRKLITQPDQSKLKQGVEYALVMRCLEGAYRLDQQIYKHEFGKRADMEFLALEVARMHEQLAISPDDKGTPASILSKLEINSQLFEESLSQLTQDNRIIAKYRWISDLMVLAFERYVDLFQQRHQEHSIKRCHGDLKVTNLWVEPEKPDFWGLKQLPRRLIALDCVDFNPEFCHIDTLSDVAMLAIDLEMHISNQSKIYENLQKVEEAEIAQLFLEYYQCVSQENSEKWKPLLEYYMTEKSMVCAYVSILYDERPVAGARYLEVMLYHAKRLEKMLSGEEQTIPLLVSSLVR